ncbi:glycosyltransferase [Parafrankia sp. EUN1f]|uniref:glycosyltransferase n=1 Tax=Parafrankia sp. EUN1f TaxID=102897 RepID=UPI0001C44B27|nr:glycosyltransferase [Parafrankia sp. EUN1f]EFC82423.1 hopene-associated glycosyltransferase HpnB [Parafrankia sp. EUN1f]
MLPLLVIALISLASWVFLALGWGFFWRTDQRLPRADGAEPSGDWPSVVAVVPARDEADVLPLTLPSLLTQDYPGPLSIVLVDDASTDGTGEIAQKLAAQAAADRPNAAVPNGVVLNRAGADGAGADGAGSGGAVTLTVIGSSEPPAGWTGKLWALRHGVAAAGPAEFLLLTDADIGHEPGSVRALVRAATDHRLDLVSQMARLRVSTGWEKLIVPAFVYFFAMLYPFRWSNNPRSRVAAAAGGCSLVRRRALIEAGGIEAIRDAVIDDVTLARLIKNKRGRTWLGLADHVSSRRPYPRLADLWDMVARTAYAQLFWSPLLLVGTVFGLAVVFVAPVAATVVGIAAGDVAVAAAGLLAWSIMITTYTPMLRYYGQPARSALALPFTAALYLAMTIDSARRHRAGRGAAWKGRTYAAPEGKRAGQRAEPAAQAEDVVRQRADETTEIV